MSGYATILNKYDITNRYTPGMTSVSVMKFWDDDNDRDGKRPAEVEVQLLADGKASGNPVKLNKANGWRYTWTDLPEKDAGTVINYTVKEVSVKGYVVELRGDAVTGFVLINRYTPETVKVEGSKTWKDSNNAAGKRPYAITVGLFADGKLVDARTVTSENNWRWSFTDLPKYRDGGVKIVYTINQQVIAYYTPTVKGYNITNTYTPSDPPPFNPPGPPHYYPPNYPKTGDDSNIGAWMIPFAVSGAALAAAGGVLAFHKKKKKGSEER